jgi:diaminopimelate decarboxylase
MNVDSLDQVREVVALSPRTSLGLRVLVDRADKRNRIGLTTDEVDAAVEIASKSGWRIDGLHMYVGTNTGRVSRFLECLSILAGVAPRVADLEYIDVGGGYGIGYRELEQGLDLDAAGAEIAARMHAVSADLGRPISLVLEPGRALVGTAGTLLTKVVSVKERGGRRYVGVDATVANFTVPSVYHVRHRVEALQGGSPAALPADVCGNTTHSGDFLARDIALPDVQAGDVLALRDVGAYAYAMSSHFLNRLRPAEVVLDGDEAILTTRGRRMTIS